jgi:hypothetical protein
MICSLGKSCQAAGCIQRHEPIGAKQGMGSHYKIN